MADTYDTEWRRKFARGLRVCANMLDTLEIDECTIEETVIEQDNGVKGVDVARARDGRQQDNAVLRVLRQVLQRNDVAELEGFCAGLTEACAWADQSGDHSREFKRLVTQEMAHV